MAGACAAQQGSIPRSNKVVQVASVLPSGVSCRLIDTIETLDGAECANLGRNRVGQEQILRYNLTQKARKRGANLMIPEAPFSQSWEGCPGFGLSMRAQIYDCDFQR